MSLLAGISGAIAKVLRGDPPPRCRRTPPGVRRADKLADRWPAFVPTANPLETDAGYATRQEAALRMMDPDCYGFLLVSVHREAVGLRAEIELHSHIDPSWGPAMAETLDRVAAVARNDL